MYRSFVFIQSEFLLGVSVSLVPAWGDLFVNYVWTMWTWFITIIAYKGFWNLYVGYKYAWSNTQCGSYSHYIWFMFTNQVVYKLALLLPMGPQTVVNPYIYSNYQILSNTYGGSYSHYLYVYYIYICVCVFHRAISTWLHCRLCLGGHPWIWSTINCAAYSCDISWN